MNIVYGGGGLAQNRIPLSSTAFLKKSSPDIISSLLFLALFVVFYLSSHDYGGEQN